MSINPIEILQSFREQLGDPDEEREKRIAENTTIAEQARTLTRATENDVKRKTILAKARAARGKDSKED